MAGFDGTVNVYHASAGTGKTTNLLNIIEKHLKEGVDIERIAFLTFTRKGAEVAQLRTAERFGIDPTRLKNFRTIHSLAFNRVGAGKDSMMNPDRYKDFGDKANYRFGNLALNIAEGVDWNETKDARLIALEQLYRNNRKYADSVMDGRVEWEDFSRFLYLYKKYKQTFNYRDFTDLLEEYIAGDYSEDVDVVCLDEMQDSSILQWQMLFQAYKHTESVYVSGDDKQAIFTWAGASPSTLINLRGNIHFLDTSYRVPSKILDYANMLADEIQEKAGLSKCKAIKQGGELKELLNIREVLIDFDYSKTYFMLARNNKFLKQYEELCKELAVPYKLKGVPIFSEVMKRQLRDGDTEEWDADMLDYAKRCSQNGTFYDEPKINIATVHTVKGDEADRVVLMSDISRAVYSQLEIDEDSEHRVFYVGVTRAKETLYIIQPQTKMYYPYLF